MRGDIHTERNSRSVISECIMEDEAPSVDSVTDVCDYADFIPQIASSEISKEPETTIVQHISDTLVQTGCSSADLLNAVKLRHSVSDRAAVNFLELMKLPGFDPTSIRHADIKRHEDVTNTSAIKSVLRCASCLSVLDRQPCPENW